MYISIYKCNHIVYASTTSKTENQESKIIKRHIFLNNRQPSISHSSIPQCHTGIIIPCTIIPHDI